MLRNCCLIVAECIFRAFEQLNVEVKGILGNSILHLKYTRRKGRKWLREFYVAICLLHTASSQFVADVEIAFYNFLCTNNNICM